MNIDTLFVASSNSQALLDSFYVSLIDSTGKVDTTFLLKSSRLIIGSPNITQVHWWENSLTSMIVSIFIGIIAIIITFHFAKKTSIHLNKIREFSEEIQDYTRKPLHGIVDVLYEIFLLTSKTKLGGNFYFVGFTLGLGRAHCIEKNFELWKQKCPHNSTLLNKVHQFNSDIRGVIAASNPKESIIITYTESKLEELFINKLYQENEINHDYRLYKDAMGNEWFNKLVNETKALHNSVIDKTIEAHTLVTLDNIPLQIVISEIVDDGRKKLAAVIFNIGTNNLGYEEVQGFYTELEDVCNQFINYAKSLKQLNNEN